MVSTLPDERLVHLMELRYLDSYSWEEVAAALGYSPSQTFKLHRAALQQFTIHNS